MANLSNINNKFLFTDGDFLKIGNLAPINNISGTESGISITNSNVASITLDNTAASGKRYIMYSSGNGSLVFWDGDAGSARLQIDSSGNSTFSGSVTSSYLAVNGSAIVAEFNGTGSSYVQGAIALRSSNADTPEARGQGVFMYNQGTDTTWYTGTTYSNADRFIIGRATDASLNTEAARINNSFLTVLNSGNVGIGETSPQRKLQVTNSADGFISRFTGGANSDVNIGIFGHSTSNFGSIGTESDDRFSLFTNGVDRLNITNTGNVGIGVISSIGKLDILGVAGSVGSLGQLNRAGINLRIPNVVGQYTQIAFSNDGGGAYGYGAIGMVMTSSSGVGLGDMIFSTKGLGTDVVSTERMRIKSDGNVLISSGGLTVGATSQVAGTQVAIVGGGVTNLQRWGSTSDGGNQASYRFRIDQSYKFIANNGSGDNLVIDSGNGSIIPNGGVYLGGTATANKLDDYEEGTWTPVTGPSTTVPTYLYRSGYYTKVGNLVTCIFGLKHNGGVWTGGEAIISGLPFTITSTGPYQEPMFIVTTIGNAPTGVGGNNANGALNLGELSFYLGGGGTIGRGRRFIYNNDSVLPANNVFATTSFIKATIIYYTTQ